MGVQEGCSLSSEPPSEASGCRCAKAQCPQPSERTGGAWSGPSPQEGRCPPWAPHPWTPHEYHLLCVGCRGVALADALGVVLGGQWEGVAGLVLPEGP